MKLPRGNWFSFTGSTEFIYNQNKVRQYEPERGLLYLNTQMLNFSGIMNIFSIQLNFKSYEFVKNHTQMVLENGLLKLSYNFTEIPTLFNIIDFVIRPDLSLHFTPEKQPYYLENGEIEMSTPGYYDNNRLLSSLELH